MKIVRLQQKSDKKILSRAGRILRSGGIVVVPTDTVYGIVGAATSVAAITKIFAMKGRSQEKVFSIFVKDIETSRKYAYISDAKAKFLEKMWPGPMIVVFKSKEKLPKILTGKNDTIGIRIPNNPFILELLARLDFPLVQTSANIFSKPPAKNLKEIIEYFGGAEVKPDLVIDIGLLDGKSSAVIDFTGKEPLVLRTGVLRKSELDQLLSSF